MAHDTDELRAEIEDRRQEITETVEQIENRIVPSRIMARRRDRMRRRMTDWKDAVFGNDEPQYRSAWAPPSAYAAKQDAQDSAGMLGRAGEATTHAFESARDGVEHAPEMIRRQTRGNPMAAGVIALGAGWLVGSMLPKTEEERRLARRLEPALAGTASTVAEEGRSLASDLREPIKEAADEVKQTGQEAAGEIREHVRSESAGT